MPQKTETVSIHQTTATTVTQNSKREAGAASTTLFPFPFREHSTDCALCKHSERCGKGGRPRKPQKIAQSTVQHIRSCAGPKLASAAFDLSRDRFREPSPALSTSLTDLQCPFCACIVDEAVQLSCRALICLGCALWTVHRGDNCPSCHTEHEPSSVTAAPTVVINLLLNQVLKCICGKQIQLQHLQQHLNSGYKEFIVESPVTVTVEDILQQPLDAPATSLEKRTAGHLVRKMLHQSESATICLPTGGHVSIYHLIHKVQGSYPILI